MSQHVLAVELMDADGEVHLLDGRARSWPAWTSAG
jgi:hypothetical protein